MSLLCSGGTASSRHLGVHDGAGGDRGSGEDVSRHLQARPRRLRVHGGSAPVCISASGAATQGVPAGSQGEHQETIRKRTLSV